MNRRDVFAAMAAGAAAVPAFAQQGQAPRRVAFVLGLPGGRETQKRLDIFRRRLSELGWAEGRNLEITPWFGVGDPAKNDELLASFRRIPPDVVVSTNVITINSVVGDFKHLPLVFPFQTDPIARGYVQSLAKPGGNATGFALFEASVAGKWLELLKDIAPKTRRVVVLTDLHNGSETLFRDVLAATSKVLDLEIQTAFVRNEADIIVALEALRSARDGGIVLLPGPQLETHREAIFAVATNYRLPAIYPYRYLTEAGGLASFSPDVLELFRRSAEYVDRIFKGARPSDLPVQMPTKYELVVNRRTATALGLTIPAAIESVADEVIE